MPKAIPARLVRVLSVFRTNLHLLTDPADLLAAEALLGAAPAVLALLDVIDRSPAGPAFARGGVQNFRGLIDNLARSPEEQAAFQTIFETLLRLAAARKGAEKGAPEEGLRNTDVLSNERSKLFLALAEQWRAETGFYASVSRRVQHPAYRKIVQMGKTVLPLILAELRDRPGHWFSALSEIVGTTPVGEDERGSVQKSREAWLSWGRDNGYLD